MQIVTTKASTKVAAVATALAMASSMLSFAPMVHAETAAACSVGTTDLTVNSTGPAVECLQKALVAGGYLVMPAGVNYGYFGQLTKSAVMKWQVAKGITPAAGYFGPISRGAFSPVAGGGTGTGTGTGSSTGGALEGGAGSVDDYSIVSTYNNEEVGEGAEDVKVAGLEIEADEGSDLQFTAVKIAFDESTGATSDFDEYASEVSVWFDGEEVARVDADEFNDDNNWTKTLSLDGGAIVEAGDTGKLVVAVSGNSSIDSGDEGDAWTVDFTQVRFRDADGATITDTVTENAVTFSFESFAAAADINLKVSAGDTDVNDARAIAVDDNDDTDGVEVLSFKIKAEGDADLTVDDLSVDFTSVGAGVGEIINSSALEIDGDTFSASSTIASTTATTMTVTYENLDLTIDAGDTVTVVVLVDVNNLSGAFLGGETLTADVNPDDTAWDVEDEEGDTLGAGDKSGTATSDAHSFFADGLNITKGAADVAELKDTNGDTAGGEQGIYTVRFDVTAFGDDLYIPTGATIATSSVTAASGISYGISGDDGVLDMLNAAALSSTTAAVSSTATQSGSYFIVREGETETFELNVTLTPVADGYYRARVYGVNFNVGAAAAADTLQQALPATDFATSLINLDV